MNHEITISDINQAINQEIDKEIIIASSYQGKKKQSKVLTYNVLHSLFTIHIFNAGDEKVFHAHSPKEALAIYNSN